MNQYYHDTKDIRNVIETYYPKGYFDREMADIYEVIYSKHISRAAIGKHRRAMGLKANRDAVGNQRYRELRSRLSRETLEQMGELALVDVRRQSRRLKALRTYGWIDAETEREARLLDLMHAHPEGITREQAATSLGYSVGRNAKKNSAIDKSIYALVNRGVVLRGRRVTTKRVLGQGRGRSITQRLYKLAPNIKKKYANRKELNQYGDEVSQDA